MIVNVNIFFTECLVFVTLWDSMCDMSATAVTLLCAAHATSIHSQHVCVVDQKNLGHLPLPG